MTKPIKNNQQYEDALERAYELMQLELPEGSIDSDELEVLSILIKEYELEHFPIPSPKPLEAIRFRMEQLNLSESDLSAILGARSRKSEILSGKRKLSLGMIRKVYGKLKIPVEVLIREY